MGDGDPAPRGRIGLAVDRGSGDTGAVDPAAKQRLMTDLAHMTQARIRADAVRRTARPNPWVGAVVVPHSPARTPARPAGAGTDGATTGAPAPPTGAYVGATQPPGGNHAEIEALAAAGPHAQGATLYVTLEPCCHQGRTGPCTDAIIAAGVARVVVAIEDPDPNVSGKGIAALRGAGVEVDVGVGADSIERQLAPYLVHRRTGRPLVVLKLAASLDGRTAAADGTSRWITGAAARADVHALRADSDAVLVGAGTVRADDPELTVRLVEGPDPLRVVLGTAPAGAKVHPALELGGDLGEVLDELGRRDVLQLLVEGGPTVAQAFHDTGLVDRYVLYLAPALLGSGGLALLPGPGAATIAEAWRGQLVDVRRVGDDVRVEMEPR